jgi:hypothetical protein
MSVDMEQLEINLALIVAAAIESSEFQRLLIKADKLVNDYSNRQLAISYDHEADMMIVELVDMDEEDAP